MGNQFGTLFRISTFGESHGTAIGCIIDGCPAGIPIPLQAIQEFLNRRRPGQNEFTTSRQELDCCEIISGIENNISLGTPITIIVKNKDKKPEDYKDLLNLYRPSHADYTSQLKFGQSNLSGGGRSSARETIGRVAAAAVAKCYLNSIIPKLNIIAYVERIQNIKANIDPTKVTTEAVEKSTLRCPNDIKTNEMINLLTKIKNEGNTVGGLIGCIIQNPPTGCGEPVFDKFDALLAHAMLSIPACKSFEIGSGIDGTYLTGSDHNDEFMNDENNNIITKTNNSGGIQGGITNGMPILFKVGFKPVSTIFKAQNTLTKDGQNINYTPQNGRHDPCVLPRAVPIVEAMAWLVLADLFLLQQVSKIKNSGAPTI